MHLPVGEASRLGFEAYIAEMAGVTRHADRAAPPHRPAAARRARSR